nr:unnamed protein product [Callosobruchus analis]
MLSYYSVSSDWLTHIYQTDEGVGNLLGAEYDPQILNKIRFALPTVGLVQAFNPGATHISEKGYMEMKLKMLTFPFCIGLIIRPTCLAAKIRGSAFYCLHYNYQLNGCQSCEAYAAVSEFSKQSLVLESDPEVDWVAWCIRKCHQGDGGAACNCDLLPMGLIINN